MKGWVTAAVLAVCFVVLGMGIHTDAVMEIDLAVGDFFFNLRVDGLNPAVKAFSGLGSTMGYVIIFVIVLIGALWLRKWKSAVWLTVGLVAGWLLNKVLKAMYHRERPVLWENLVEPDGFSFPSGNAMVSAAFYGLLALMLLRSRKGWVRICGILVMIVVVLIGVSRMYLGVHFVSDIAGGLLAGGCIAAVCYQLWRKAGE